MPNQKIPETLIWKAPSHIQHNRSSAWYLIFSLVSLSLLLYAVYSRSWLTLATFALIVIVTLILSLQPSREITYKITKTGVAVSKTEYPYSIIKKFWIIYNPPSVKTLNFETSAYINNRVVIQLGNQDPVEVKLVLSRYLREDLDAEESITDKLARNLKI